MNCVIIDDDITCIDALAASIKNYCPQLLIVGTATCILDAVKLINDTHPQLVFLDVEINEEFGFDLFKYFPSPDFEVVFSTAHEKYALKAIKSSCYDFLLKPVAIDELVNVVAKLEKEQILKPQENINTLLGNLYAKENKIQKIAIPSSEGYNFINIEDLVSLEGDGKYTKITTINASKHLSSKSLGDYEELLDMSVFYRTHKSWIVNIKHITKFMRNESQVLLSNGTLADVSSRKREDFLKLFK